LVNVDLTGASMNSLASDQSGGLAFATTHWSVVLTAQGMSPAADQALEKLCRTYWPPLYAFVRRQGHGIEEAQDLTQGFFERILERRDLNAVRQEKGRLRSYLLISLKHFLANEHHRATAMKRGEGRPFIPLDELREHERVETQHFDLASADKIYERRWALTVLDQVLARLAAEYQGSNNLKLFKRLKELLADEPGRPSQADIARELSMTEDAVKQAFQRFRERYRRLLRDEIAHTVATPGDIEDELRHLITVLRT
jgi:RNA polymerase sigma factor (sigma-70 family)